MATYMTVPMISFWRSAWCILTLISIVAIASGATPEEKKQQENQVKLYTAMITRTSAAHRTACAWSRFYKRCAFAGGGLLVAGYIAAWHLDHTQPSDLRALLPTALKVLGSIALYFGTTLSLDSHINATVFYGQSEIAHLKQENLKLNQALCYTAANFQSLKTKFQNWETAIDIPANILRCTTIPYPSTNTDAYTWYSVFRSLTGEPQSLISEDQTPALPM